jgi:hypothetical protein
MIIYTVQKEELVGTQWLTCVNLATSEAEVRRIMV